MGFFDALSFGASDALGVKPNYAEYAQQDAQQYQMLDRELTRSYNETKDAASRMERVQLTTGAGVNAKLQRFYDGLTQELKATISKNNNYKNDPFQMQQVNAVVNKYANNEIISNDKLSQQSYNDFKKLAMSGGLSAADIAHGEKEWERYRNGETDVFSYSNPKKVDYNDEAIKVSSAIKRLTKKKGFYNNVNPADHKKAMEGLMTNPDYADKAMTDFKNLPLEDQAHWLNIPYKEDGNDEAIKELISKKLDMLGSSGHMATPVVNWLSDRYYPYTNRELDTIEKMSYMEEMRAKRAAAKSVAPPVDYWSRDIAPALNDAIISAKENPGTFGSWNVKLKNASSLFPNNINGVPSGNYMRLGVTDASGQRISLPIKTVGWFDPGQTKAKNAYDGMVVKKNNGEIRIGAKIPGFVSKGNYENFISSIGVNVSLKDGNIYTFSSNGRSIASINAASKSDAVLKFMVSNLGGSHMVQQTSGIGSLISQPEGVYIDYECYTGANPDANMLQHNYNTEAIRSQKAYQIKYDTQGNPVSDQPSQQESQSSFSMTSIPQIH